MATTVTRTHLIVTLYVDYLCFNNFPFRFYKALRSPFLCKISK